MEKTIRQLLEEGTITPNTRVLGSLPMTADGCIVVGGSMVFDRSGRYHFVEGLEGNGPIAWKDDWCLLIGDCYSTKEAAERAAEGKKP